MKPVSCCCWFSNRKFHLDKLSNKVDLRIARLEFRSFSEHFKKERLNKKVYGLVNDIIIWWNLIKVQPKIFSQLKRSLFWVFENVARLYRFLYENLKTLFVLIIRKWDPPDRYLFIYPIQRGDFKEDLAERIGNSWFHPASADGWIRQLSVRATASMIYSSSVPFARKMLYYGLRLQQA